MKLRDIMTPNPITLRPEQSVQEAAALFSDRQVDGAPVIDENGNIIGLFTKSHIFRMVSQGMNAHTPLSEFMTRQVNTGHPDDNIEDYLNPGVGRLPILDGNNIVGIITRSDLFAAFFRSYKEISTELDTIINSTHNLIVAVNEKGIITVFNKAAEINLGMKADEARGKKVIDIFPTSGLIDVAHTGNAEPVKNLILSGRKFLSNRTPIYKNGKLAGAVAVLQDISEIENISRELEYVKELNRELDAIIDSSFDGLYITDGDGLTLRLNKAYERITGVSESEFIGRNVTDIETEGIVSESVTALAIKKKEPVTIIQEMKTGKTTLSTASPVYDEVGNIFRVVSNVRDITELNMLKQKLEEVEGLSQHYESQLRTLRLQYKGSNNIIINSSKMKDLFDMVIRLAQFDSTILITGESGTGKELIAETIHKNSNRINGPYIKVNCGAIPENLLESELFGYEYGAFTGAKKEGKAGYFQLATGGTLFLDEIGDLPYNLQVKLLRVLQNREIVRVGGVKSIPVDARIVTGTNHKLLELVEKKMFREDLYYRLNVVPVHVPPLRDRKEDIPPLVAHFMQMFNRKHKLDKKISPEVVEIFMGYNWPGNVRELENLIERLLVISTKIVLTREDLPSFISEALLENTSEVFVSGIIPLHDAVESVERQILEKAYAKFRTTRQMAKELKVDASTVVRKAAKYGISHLGRNI
ncbi:MAG: sigma 54-interacting transcriptional regulator [Syntrophomonas sp.]|nr:sigma 54-interacting transcriptional regulator [Syntrophomonas sp.]